MDLMKGLYAFLVRRCTRLMLITSGESETYGKVLLQLRDRLQILPDLGVHPAGKLSKELNWHM